MGQADRTLGLVAAPGSSVVRSVRMPLMWLVNYGSASLISMGPIHPMTRDRCSELNPS